MTPTTDTSHIAGRDRRLSVIIPVYNMEDSLDRCVESVVAQNCGGLEIILVDDGSTDNSPALCDKWAERDDRVVVVHKQNGGLSDARNCGLDNATGCLVTFVDADDLVARGTYSEVLDAMDDDCDIMEFPIMRFYGTDRQTVLSFGGETYADKADYWLRGKAYAHSYMCNKIFRRRLFDSERFPEGLLFEDVHTLPRLLDHCRKVCNTSQGLYCYCDNPRSITATADGKALRSLLEAHLATGMVTADEAYYLHVLNIQLSVCGMTGERPVLSPMRTIRFRGLNAAMLLKVVALKILGLNNLCKLYRTICRTMRLW